MWGHAWPRGGAGSRPDVMRDVMRRLASVILVYTERQKEELHGAPPKSAQVVAAPNALYRRADMVGAPAAEATDILYAARLIAVEEA